MGNRTSLQPDHPDQGEKGQQQQPPTSHQQQHHVRFDIIKRASDLYLLDLTRQILFHAH